MRLACVGLACVSLLLLLGCASAPEITAPTWSAEIQPLMAQHCMGCHQEGGLSFALTDYAQVMAVGPAILDAVQTGRMPPFLAEPESCRPLQGSRRLNAVQVERFDAWMSADFPYGLELEPTPIPPVETLSQANEVLRTPAFSPDVSQGDEWRCFVLEGDPELRFLQAYSVTPQNREVVHHVSLFSPVDSESAEGARVLDQGQGYTCFGDTLVPSLLVAIWSPGQDLYRYPEGTGVRLEPGLPLIAQVHYSGALDPGVSEETEIALQTAVQVDWPVWPLFFLHDSFELAPGQSEVHSEREMSLGQAITQMGAQDQLPQESFRIFGAGVHMHLMGRSVSARVGEQCLVDVPEWDYGWHDLYFYKESLELSRQDTVSIECAWDTSSATGPVVWGDSLEDEMCGVLLLASPLD